MVRAIRQAYSEPKKGEYVTGPLITGPGKLGPAFPEDENPHDLASGDESLRSLSRTRSAAPS